MPLQVKKEKSTQLLLNRKSPGRSARGTFFNSKSQFRSKSQLYIADHSFYAFTLLPMMAIQVPINAIMEKEMLKLDACATKPISGGPIRKPR